MAKYAMDVPSTQRADVPTYLMSLLMVVESIVQESHISSNRQAAVICDSDAKRLTTQANLDMVQNSVDNMNWIKAFNVKAIDDNLKDLIAKHVPNNKYLNDSKKIIPPTSAANSLTRDDSPLRDYAMKAKYAEFERLIVHAPLLPSCNDPVIMPISSSPLRNSKTRTPMTLRGLLKAEAHLAVIAQA